MVGNAAILVIKSIFLILYIYIYIYIYHIKIIKKSKKTLIKQKLLWKHFKKQF